MRNLKKILALVLALVMALSVMSVAGALKLDDYADAESVTPQFQTAVDVATQLGVLNGMNATEYQPKGNLTRAQLATIIYRITTGDVDGTYVSNFVEGVSQFDDVTSAHWAAGYIGFCADAGYLEGWGGSYHPEQAMTGYQALAALLRALGYNEPGEFSGPQWTVRVAQIATQTRVSDGVVTDLNKAITREQTAQFIYNALWTEQVVYTPAFGYNNITTQPWLVTDSFDVVTAKPGVTGEADKWGRPETVWYRSNNSKAIEIIDDPVATYTVAVDECDIARDMNLSRDTAIESAYIDGELIADADATTDREGDIGVYDTTSYVGAQGRITEVYNMGPAGVRIVEINTYLARVTGVTAATEDKNKHPVDPSITVQVWEDVANDNQPSWRFVVPRATGYAVNDYVLVYVHQPSGYSVATQLNRASVSAGDVRKAPVAGTNALYTYTTTTHTFGTALSNTSYYNADKFELNDETFSTWIILTDDYGNVIGLVTPDTNYLAIEVISWIDSGILNGYALANVVLADGTKVENVRISNVNNRAAWNKDDQGLTSEASVSDGWTRNTDYYGHAWTYTVNADGSYNIGAVPDGAAMDNIQHDDGSSIYDMDGASILQNQATIQNSINSVVATDNTVFLLKGANDYSYSVYVGKNNVPSGSGDICVVTDNNQWATLVVCANFVAAGGGTYLAYVTDADVDYWYSASNVGYRVYKLGEVTETVAVESSTTHLRTAFAGDGVYQFTESPAGVVTGVSKVLLGVDDAPLTSDTKTVSSFHLDRAAVRNTSNGLSLQTQNYTGVTAVPNVVDTDLYQVNLAGLTTNKDFSLGAEMPVIRVTTTTSALGVSSVSLAYDSLANVTARDVVIVGYTTTGSGATAIHTAAVVYVFSGFVMPTYTVTAKETLDGAAKTFGTNMTATGIPATVAYNGTFTFTVAPKEGYEVNSVSASDGSVTDNGDGTYTVAGVTANTTITIDMVEELPYAVTVTENGEEVANVTVTGVPAGKVAAGTDVTFTVTANAGYKVTSVDASDADGVVAVTDKGNGSYELTVNKDTAIDITTVEAHYVRGAAVPTMSFMPQAVGSSAATHNDTQIKALADGIYQFNTIPYLEGSGPIKHSTDPLDFLFLKFTTKVANDTTTLTIYADDGTQVYVETTTTSNSWDADTGHYYFLHVTDNGTLVEGGTADGQTTGVVNPSGASGTLKGDTTTPGTALTTGTYHYVIKDATGNVLLSGSFTVS